VHGPTMFTSRALAWDEPAPIQSLLVLASEEVGLDTEKGAMYLRALDSQYELVPGAARKERGLRYGRMST